MPMQYTCIAISHGCNNGNFQMKEIVIFVFEQKYENNVYPCKPLFYYMNLNATKRPFGHFDVNVLKLGNSEKIMLYAFLKLHLTFTYFMLFSCKYH